jgi:radical SAM superfamily enzyme YgiQ (UPF0313 family)
MSKVVLVNPPLTLEERYGNLAAAGTSLPPLGLTILAAVLREKGHEVRIIDAAVLGLSYEDTIKNILYEKPKYVGTTSVTVSIFNAAKLNMILKERDNEIKTIVGGPHVTALPVDTLERFPQFDYCVVGEGEISLVNLLNHIEEKSNLNNVGGIVFRDNGKVKFTGRIDYIRDLDTLPMDAWDLLPNFPHGYKSSVHKLGRFPTSSLITSRGCPGQCIFCDNLTFGQKIRGYSAEKVVDTMKYLVKNYGIKDIFINDDNFIALRKRCYEICELLQKEKIDLTWGCYSRVDIVKRDLLKMMKTAGCWRIAYGLESGSQEALNEMRKKETLEQMEQAVRWTKEAGIRAKGFFMIGNPLETEETLKKTIKFAKKLELDDFHVTFLSPMPGSELYRNAEKYGTFERDWKRLTGWHPVFVPFGVTKAIMEKYRKKAFLEFYLRPKIIWSYLKNIKTYADIRKLVLGGYTLIRSSFTKNI